jgi:hypothetical protein
MNLYRKSFFISICGALLAIGLVSNAAAVPVTVVVQDSHGHGIPGIHVRYGAGDTYSTAYFGYTDVNGKITGDLNAGKYSFQAPYHNGSQIRKLDTEVGLNNTVSFRTEEITMKLSACDTGNGLYGGTIRYGAGANFGTSFWPTSTDSNGEASAELFPGIYSFEMRENGTVQTKQELYVDRSSPVVEWQATNVILDHSGTISYGGSNGGSAWYVNPMYMMPGDVVFQFSNYYSGPTPIRIEGCTFHKLATVVSVQASDGSGDEVPAGVKWYKWGHAGDKHVVNKKSDAKKVVLLDPAEIGNSDVAFMATRNNVSNMLRQDPYTNSIYEFPTVDTTVALVDHSGAPIDERAKVQYYGWGGAVQKFEDAWIEPGNGGMVDIHNLLPGNQYSFLINYNYTDDASGATMINGGETVTFQTGQVVNGAFIATKYYQWGNASNKRSFTDGMELLPRHVQFLDAGNAAHTLNPVIAGSVNTLN